MVNYKIMSIEGARECHKCGRKLTFTSHSDIILYADNGNPDPKTLGWVCAIGTGCRNVENISSKTAT